MKLSLELNNKGKRIEVPASRTLMDVLRSHGFWSIRRGCETASCGNCTVILDGKAVYSCNRLAAQVDRRKIETYEMFEEDGSLEPLKQAFSDYVDSDCNYCLAGFILSLKAVFDLNPEPTEEEIVDAVAGNHCRCAQTPLPVEEIMAAGKKMRGTW